MTREDGEVERADKTGPLKTRRAVVVVIREIRSKKQERNHEGRDLAGAMSYDISRPDKGVSGEQQQRACAV